MKGAWWGKHFHSQFHYYVTGCSCHYLVVSSQMWSYSSEAAAAGDAWTNCVFLSLQVLGLKLPNMLGRAEKLTFQFSYGTKETSYGLSFFKPQPGHFERKYVSDFEVFWILCSWCVCVFAHILTTMNDYICFSLTLNMYKVTGQFPWSSLKETDRGLSAEVNVRACILAVPAQHLDLTLFALAVNWRSAFARALAVSSREDQPHVEVGGCVEGAGLPGTQRLFRSARREWTLSEICPLGTAFPSHHGFLLSLVSSENVKSFILQWCAEASGIVWPLHTFSTTLVLFVCSTLCQSIQGILPYFPAEVPYSGSIR